MVAGGCAGTAESKVSVEEHIGLVHLCARRFSGKGIEYDDLFQAGCVGLMKAAENFEVQRGNKFSTYAVPVILGEIQGLFRSGGAVKVSRGMRELSRKAQKEAEAFQEETGTSPSVSDIAERMGISREKVALALGAMKAPLSLSGGNGGDEAGVLEIPVEAPEEQMTDHMTLHQILASLSEQDRNLLTYRYFQSKTQHQTAELLGMTQVQVSRREKKLLLLMRGMMNGGG